MSGSSSSSSSFSASGSLSASEFSHLSSLLSSFRQKVHSHRIHLPSFFHGWDAARTGTVTKPQFARCLANIGFKLTHDAVELLNRVYSAPTDNTKASYKQFITDIEAGDQQSNGNNDTTSGILSSPSSSLSAFSRSLGGSARTLTGAALTLDNLLSKLQTIVKRQRMHINDLFDDFDQLRKRRVTVQQFRRCLDLAGFGLSEEEFQLLANRYQDAIDNNQVKYDDLIRDVTIAFVPLEIEKCPTLSPEEFRPLAFSQAAASDSAVDSLVAHFGYLTHTRRILLKPSFHHFDKANHGEVTVSQFESVCSSLFPMRLETAELHALAAAYQSPLNAGMVNYAQFVADVSAAEQEYERTYLSRSVSMTGAVEPISQLSRSGSITVPAHVNIQPQIVPQRDLAALLAYLREYTAKQRIINVETIFYDFDPLRHGFVTASRFFRALLMAGLKISQQEAELLCDQFRSTKEENAVDYVSFAGELSTVPKF